MTRLPTGASRWQQLKRMLEHAIELPPAEQKSYLEDACAGDTSLRRSIESLLVHAGADDFPESGVARAASETHRRTEPVNLEGQRLGPYKIIKRIGEGGLGSVYLAERADGEPAERVAIKVVRHRVASESALRRFRAERQFLSDLDHPNIARLIDAGTTDDGLPYLVMEYVEGEPIDEYSNNRRLTITQRLQLFRQVCAAVQKAHDRHVVHRDLKPANVLITKDGTPRLLDFGIAKLLAPDILDCSVELTAEFQWLMTPAFASPEQIRGETITPASDVYSLGVILYGLVCGHSPYDAGNETPAAAEKIVCELEPAAPSKALRQFAHTAGRNGESIAMTPEAVSAARGTMAVELTAQLEGGVDALVLRALAKQPAGRYATAAAMGEAIDAYIRDGVGESLITTPRVPEQRVPEQHVPEQHVPEPRVPEPPPPAPPVEWGHLQILQKVGAGAFGEVFKCRDPSLETTVALKLFRTRDGAAHTNVSAEVAERILREGRLLARIKHPNVVQVLGAAVHDDAVGLWMEYIDGKNFEDLLQQQGRSGSREIGLLGIDLCSALAAVHAQGVVHRDIKAQNVIREEGGRVVLTDFGSGRDLAAQSSRRDMVAVGTPLYMAPEVLRGAVATVRSDIYSMGVLLFRLVTGVFPLEARTLAELIDKHERGESRLVRDARATVKPDIAHVIETALAPDPRDRYASAGQMLHALEEATRPADMVERLIMVIAAMGATIAAFMFLFIVGLMGSVVFRTSLGIPEGVAAGSFGGYLQAGFQSMIPGVVSILISALVLLGALRIARHIRGDRPEQAPKAGSVTLARRILAFGLAGIVLNIFLHRELWYAIIALSDSNSLLDADLTLLGNWQRQYIHEWTFAALAAAMLVGMGAVSSRSRKMGDGGSRLIGLQLCLVATAALAALLMAMPWKLLVEPHTTFTFRPREDDVVRWVDPATQTGDLTGARAFVIDRDQGQLWVYFPDFLHGKRVDGSFEAGPTDVASIFEYGAGIALDR